jgi:hypothetical protein
VRDTISMPDIGVNLAVDVLQLIQIIYGTAALGDFDRRIS